MFKNSKAAFVLLLIIPLTIFSVYLFRSKAEHLSEFDFEVCQMKTTPTQELILGDCDRWIEFMNFSVPKTAGIEMGDVVLKSKCSEKIFVFRETIGGRKLVVELNEDGILRAKNFCD